MSEAIEVTGGRELSRTFANVRRRFLSRQKRKVEYWANKLRDQVRTGNFFKNPTPNLQQRVWADSARLENETIIADAGWGSDYGPILEWGVSPKNQQGWEIKAKTDRGLFFQKRGGDDVVTGIMSVWHPWNYGDDGSGPHWSKVLEQNEKKMVDDLASTIGDIFKRGR